jgi:sugar phosphate isomerase/epimerase
VACEQFADRIGFLAGLSFASQPAAEVVRQLAEMGYRAVEWTLAHFNPRAMHAGELRGVVKTAQDAGLAVSELVVQQDYVALDAATRQDRIALTLECIEAAADCGIPVVNLFTGPAPWDPSAPKVGADITEGAAWGLVYEAFDAIVPALEKHGAQGAVEGVWGHLCNDYYTTRPLIDHYGSSHLGVNFDPSHDILKGNLDVAWLARQWGPRIKHVHLKDAVGVQTEGLFLFPMLGEGRVDWPGLFGALGAIGYDGYLSVEFESFNYHQNVLRGDTAEAARRCLADARALLEGSEE